MYRGSANVDLDKSKPKFDSKGPLHVASVDTWEAAEPGASMQLALLSQVRGEMTSCVALPRRAIMLVLRVFGRLTGFQATSRRPFHLPST